MEPQESAQNLSGNGIELASKAQETAAQPRSPATGHTEKSQYLLVT